MGQVVLEHVSREFPGGVRAVDAVDLDVADGEFLTIVGPSGCGKTTTLRLIAGLDRPTTGTIRIAGRVVDPVPPHRPNVAMIFQQPALYPHLSVRGNMAFGLNLRYGGHWLRRAWLRMASPAAAPSSPTSVAHWLPCESGGGSSGDRDLAGPRPGELSAGERQRVALAKATLRQPAVFLFDEPLSSLDACLRVEIRRELKGLHGSLGGTVIYVTHDQIEAMTLGDRVAVLDGGRLQQIGTPIEVYTRPANRFVAGFVGTPAMNFAEGVLRRSGDGCSLVFFASDGWHVPLVPEPRAELLDRLDRPIVLGLRPGDVQLQQGRHAADAAIAARVAWSNRWETPQLCIWNSHGPRGPAEPPPNPPRCRRPYGALSRSATPQRKCAVASRLKRGSTCARPIGSIPTAERISVCGKRLRPQDDQRRRI